ncbi:FAD-dependent monooxygenase [Streptomyces morookaense]|uniref:NAD(P)/FAD-dependent oxidoreductase n=1 Tax=Streptomyces morookaense TaxID=1970 RepID=UPI0034019C9B
MSSANDRRSVVLGGGMAGMLAAAVLADHGHDVVVVERDRLPDTARARRGVPQARHAHLMMSGGARVVETLLPGAAERWLAAGARRISLPTGLVSLLAQGWLPRWPEMEYLIACSRDLLDAVVRELVLARPGITLHEGAEAAGLLGTARRVTGVRLHGEGGAEDLTADLVVDTTGRGSRAPQWLARLGLPAVREETVDSGLVYATRVFRAPPGAEDVPVVSVQAETGTSRPGRGTTLMPIEGGRWIVTLAGTRGGEPTRDTGEFEPYARTLRHPIVADLIARAEPLTEVYVTRSTVNRRRYFERLPEWPAGFLVMGDALAAYNPVYGHGMSVAAHGAAALRAALRTEGAGDGSGVARRAQQAAAAAAGPAWDLATGEDLNYPGAVGGRPPVAARLLRGYVQRTMLTATANPAVTRPLLEVMTLSRPLSGLFTPQVALHVLRGPGRRRAAEPPISAAERERWGLARV